MGMIHPQKGSRVAALLIAISVPTGRNLFDLQYVVEMTCFCRRVTEGVAGSAILVTYRFRTLVDKTGQPECLSWISDL